MTLATGNQVGPGTFWSDATNLADPKRVGRWIVTIEPGINRESRTNGFLQFMAKKVGKPNFEVTEAEHSYINHNFYWHSRELHLIYPHHLDLHESLKQ